MIKFMVTSVPTSTTITITMPSNETGSGATTSGGIRFKYCHPVGPAVQAKVLVGHLDHGVVKTLVQLHLSINSINSSQTTGIILVNDALFPTAGTNLCR